MNTYTEIFSYRTSLTADDMLPAAQMLHEALFVGAYLGIPIFPVNPSTQKGKAKTPLIQGGFKSATTDIDTIKIYWGERFKEAMIGVPTGQASKLVVVDLDIKNGLNGVEALQKLADEAGEMYPITKTIRTPSTGEHLYFKMPDLLIKSSASLLGPGIDIRADGGYIVYEGSINEDGDMYQLIDDSPIAPLPTWLLEKLLTTQNKKDKIFIKGEIQEGSRNVNLSKILGSLRAFHMEEEDLIKTGLFMNSNFIKPPMHEDEVREIAASIGVRPRSYSFDVIGNADRFVHRYSDYAKCQGGKNWYIWEDGVFTLDTKKRCNEMAKQIAKDLDAEVKNMPEKNPKDMDDIQKGLMKLAQVTRNNPLNMLTVAVSDPRIAIDREKFDSHPHLLNCSNCIVNLNTGESLIHDPKYLLTKKCNANYYPEAKADRWIEFLDYTTNGDQELMEFLARLYGGIGLFGGNPAQVMAIIFGHGRNGKTIFADTLRYVMGTYADVMRQELLVVKTNQNLSHDKADMQGSRFLLASELPPEAKLNGAAIKEYTGGDTIKGRHIYENTVAFPVEGLITLVTNWEPEIEAGDFALKERLLFIKLNRTVPDDKRDPLLSQNLRQEADGILAWLMRGRMDYVGKGNRLCIPESVRRETQAFNTDMDWFEQFLEERYILDPYSREQADVLHKTYFEYMLKEYPGRHIIQKKQFATLLKRRFEKTKIDGRNYYVGLKPKPSNI